MSSINRTLGFNLQMSWRFSDRFMTWKRKGCNLTIGSDSPWYRLRAAAADVDENNWPETSPDVSISTWPPLPSGFCDSGVHPGQAGRRQRWSSRWCRSGRNHNGSPWRSPSRNPRCHSFKKEKIAAIIKEQISWHHYYIGMILHTWEEQCFDF